jgi:hypothetical protein
LGEVAVPTRLLYGADSTQYRDLGPLILPVFDQAPSPSSLTPLSSASLGLTNQGLV